MLYRFLCSVVVFFTFVSWHEPALAQAKEEPTVTSAPASAAASTPSPSAAAPIAAPSSKDSDCPSSEVVFKRIRVAAKTNAAEDNVIEGGAASQVGDVVSNIFGFGGLFNAATTAASISAHKKIADAMAADPCGEKALDAFPKTYRTAYEAYQKSVAKK